MIEGTRYLNEDSRKKKKEWGLRKKKSEGKWKGIQRRIQQTKVTKKKRHQNEKEVVIRKEWKWRMRNKKNEKVWMKSKKK